MTYTPKSGGGPAKLVAYLRSKEPGYRVSTATASAIMCLPVASIGNTLKPAIVGGLLASDMENGKLLYWLTPDAAAQEPADAGSPVEQAPAAAVPAPAPTLLSLHGIAAGSRVEPELEPEPFHAMLHIDGDLDLHGMQPLQDGGYRIHAEDVGRLMRLLGGC